MKVAMIGSGGMAEQHLKVLTNEPSLEIVGHVSRTLERSEAAASRWGGRPYRTCEELLKHERVEAAWITVPPYAHGQIEAALVEQGVPFFVEKPLAADRETAERIAARVSEQGLVVGVGYHWRAIDILSEVRQTLAENPPRLVLGAWHDGTPPPAWWQRQETSGGQMVEQATHLFDFARALVGEAEVIAATADRHNRPSYPNMDVADVSTALLRYETGTKGVFTTTCLLRGPVEVFVKFVCEGLMLTVTRERVTYETGSDRWDVAISGNPIQTENRAFLEAVRHGDPTLLLSSYDDALLTHRLCFDVLEASQNRSL